MVHTQIFILQDMLGSDPSDVGDSLGSRDCARMKDADDVGEIFVGQAGVDPTSSSRVGDWLSVRLTRFILHLLTLAEREHAALPDAWPKAPRKECLLQEPAEMGEMDSPDQQRHVLLREKVGMKMSGPYHAKPVNIEKGGSMQAARKLLLLMEGRMNESEHCPNHVNIRGRK